MESVETHQTEQESVLEKVGREAGPHFVWLRIEKTRTQCLARSGGITIPPVILPTGVQDSIEALAEGLQMSPDKADELFHSEKLSEAPACRSVIEPYFLPLARRVHDMHEGLLDDGDPVPAVIVDFPERPAPIVLWALQNLLPDRHVIALESLGIASPESMPSPFPPKVLPTEVPKEPDEEQNSSRRLAGPIRSSERDYVPPDSGFLAWIAFIAALAFVGLSIFLYLTMNQVNHRLDAVTLQLQRLQQERLANASSGSSRPAELPRIPLPPLPFANEELAPSRITLPRIAPPAQRIPYFSKKLAGLPLPPPISATPSPTPSVEKAPPAPPTIEESPASAPPKAFFSTLPVPQPSTESLTPVPLPPRVLNVPPASLRPIASDLPAPQKILIDSPSGSSADRPSEDSGAQKAPIEMSSPAASHMTFDEVVRRAPVRNLGVDAARWRQQASDAVASNLMLPYRFQWGLDAIYASSPVLTNVQAGGLYSSLGLYGSTQLDIARRRKPLQEIGSALRAQSSASLTNSEEQSRYNAAAAFFDAVSAKEAADARREMLAVEQELGRVTQKRLEEGQVPPLDTEEARSRIAAAQDQVTTAVADQEQAELKLGQTVRATPGDRVDPAPSDAAWLAALASKLESQPPQGLAEARMDVVQAAALVKERNARLDLAQKSKRPVFTAFGGLAAIDTRGSVFTPAVGVRLTAPFGDGGEHRADVKEARAVLGESRTLYQEALETAVGEITSAQIETKRSELAAGNTGARLDAGRDAARVARQRYEAGFASLTEVIEAEAELDAALRAHADARRATLKSQLDLLRAAGRLVDLPVSGSGGAL